MRSIYYLVFENLNLEVPDLANCKDCRNVSLPEPSKQIIWPESNKHIRRTPAKHTDFQEINEDHTKVICVTREHLRIPLRGVM
jgi:hypothetical protein